MPKPHVEKIIHMFGEPRTSKHPGKSQHVQETVGQVSSQVGVPKYEERDNLVLAEQRHGRIETDTTSTPLHVLRELRSENRTLWPTQ